MPTPSSILLNSTHTQFDLAELWREHSQQTVFRGKELMEGAVSKGIL
jgi:hypothetical protein